MPDSLSSPPPDANWRAHVDSQLSDLAKASTSLSERFAGLESTVVSAFKRIDTLADSLSVQAAQQRPQYSTWIGFAALVLSIVGLGTSGYVRDLERIESDVDYISKDRVSFADPVQDAAIAEIRRDMKSFVDNLHRELDQSEKLRETTQRLTGKHIDARLDHLIHRIQAMEAKPHG